MYKPVAVTYNVGEHFVCFFNLTADDLWHYYDGIKELKHPGKGIQVATTELTEVVLGSHCRSCNHGLSR